MTTTQDFINTAEKAQNAINLKNWLIEKYAENHGKVIVDLTLHDGQLKRYHGYFVQGGYIYGKKRITGRTGYPLYLEAVKSVNFITVKPKTAEDYAFKSYEEFRSYFSLKYVSEDFIKQLWNETSPQHGGKYNKRDFHYLTGKAKSLAVIFDRKFEGVGKPANNHFTNGDPSLYDDKEYQILNERSRSYTGKGRDISIGYQTNIPDRVFYASEFPGCCNGQYYFMVGKNRVMHYEND